MRFRKKPVEVEAEQFFPDAPWPEGVHITGSYCTTDDDGEWCSIHNLPHMRPLFGVQTAGGVAKAYPGDWIIREPDGQGAYPCRPDIFADTYEPVEDDDAE